jgi:hypothetical protein
MKVLVLLLLLLGTAYASEEPKDLAKDEVKPNELINWLIGALTYLWNSICELQDEVANLKANATPEQLLSKLE